MTAWLLHGFNVSDGGTDTVGLLEPYLPGTERIIDHGWAGPITVASVNDDAVAELVSRAKPGDVVIGHSNGCLIAWRAAQQVRFGAVVTINPALRRDTLWPHGMPVLNLYNSTDWVVQLGRIWGRLVTATGLETLGWGAAGRYGFTSGQSDVCNLDTHAPYWPHPVSGHSGVFRDDEALDYWGRYINQWISLTETSDKPAL